MENRMANQEKERIKSTSFVQIQRPCKIGDGILVLSSDELFDLANSFKSHTLKFTFFVPASGSGSRMFKFLYEYLNSGTESDEIKTFFHSIEDFAFYDRIPLIVRNKIGSTEKTSIASYLISKDGMGYGFMPKGLIPFHREGEQVYTPFIEHVRSAIRIFGSRAEVHFTVQEEFKDEISTHLKDFLRFEKLSCRLSFSVQNQDSDSFCFDENGDFVVEKGAFLRRPAGHGALLENLNRIDADYVLIKNIDNVQHRSCSTESDKYWKALSALLLRFEEDLQNLMLNNNLSDLKEINERYQFLSFESLDEFSDDLIQQVVNRPSRICGMVKNQGKQGGGPFWVQDKEGLSKQLVEQSQLAATSDIQSVASESTHFNPVFMVASTRNVKGKKLDLTSFVDPSKAIKVVRDHQGKTIQYLEKPGLWNGSMHDWNTLFVELPESLFTPVKSVLDLLDPAHKQQG